MTDLVSLCGLPNSLPGLHKKAKKEFWGTRFRPGVKGKVLECNSETLPLAVQSVLRERYVARLMEAETSQEPAKPVVRRQRDPDAISPLEAYRGSPQLMEERLNALTENQRQVADARIAIVREVLRIGNEPGFTCAKAIRFIVRQSETGELNERVAAFVAVANAKKGKARALSAITLKRWMAEYNKAENAAERLLLLAPGKREEMKVEEISWLADFLAQYRQANGRPMTEAYEDFVAEWNRRHAEEPYMLQIVP
ncbi:transposase, partial [Salmonella enterica subsp. enterica serovar Carmel]|nr:transposase [Salmonella enterica subsp. enterica serovar Carmel]